MDKNLTTTKPSAAPGGVPSGKSEQLAVAPGTFSDDALMGTQLTEQYHRANNAMAEIVRFGAMMWMLRETLFAREHSGHGIKGEGVKGWLKQHAPAIDRTTAYRFLHVAEAVAQDFALPAKVSFIELATSPAADLSAKLQKKQMELWDFVNGTSQRSWLDRFAPVASVGGHKPGKQPKKTAEELHEAAVATYRQETKEFALRAQTIAKDGTFKVLTDVELDAVLDHVADFVTAATAWRSMKKSERQTATIEWLKDL